MVTLLLACGVASRVSPSLQADALASLVTSAEAIVFRVAAEGPAVLFEPAGRADLRALGSPSPLFALLGAWSKLSIGRVGLLDPDSAARLPWTIVAALSPAALFSLIAPHWGKGRAVLAAAWLLAMPGWLVAVAHGEEAATLAGAWLVVFALYTASLSRSELGRARRPFCWAAACAVAFGLGMAMSRAVLGVLVLVLLHYARRNPRRALAAEARGGLLVPNALAFSIGFLPIATLLFNPALPGAPPSAIVESVFAPAPAGAFRFSTFALPLIALAAAWLAWRIGERLAPRHGVIVQVCAVTLLAAIAFARV